MTITIKARLSSGSYHARAMRLGVTASSAQSPLAAAQEVCRKLGIDPALLEYSPSEPLVTAFTHPHQPAKEASQ